MLYGVNYGSIVFPGGEVHVEVRPSGEDVTLTAYLKDSKDIMELLLVTDALRRQGTKRIWLNMPYVPYARQDRVTSPGTAHSLKVFANLINSQNYKSVSVFDPHSEVCEAVFDRLIIHNNHRFVSNMIWDFHSRMSIGAKVCLVAPDAGAVKKFDKLVAAVSNGRFDTLECSKKRDPKTGGWLHDCF